MSITLDPLSRLWGDRPWEQADLSPQSWQRLQDALDRHARLVDTLLVATLIVVATGWGIHRGVGVGDLALQMGLALPLLWRRSRPLLVFAVVAALAFAQWLVTGPLLADAAVLGALYTVARYGNRLEIAAASAVSVLGAVLAGLRWPLTRNPLETWVLLSGLLLAAVLGGIALRAGRAYFSEVVERAAQRELERDQQARLAAATERTRIAREMHDIVAHSVSLMVTLADGAAAVAPTEPARAAEAMAEVSATGRQALTNLRRTLGVLRQGDERSELAPPPGLADLPALVERVRATGLRTSLVVEGDPFSTPAAAELAAYRIVQEALTNAVKHARGAESVRVSVRYDQPALQVEVRDDGRARGRGSGGHGLKGMEERVRLFGGSLEAGPAPGGGWSVTAVVPTEGGGGPG